jgi:hypothetical protein
MFAEMKSSITFVSTKQSKTKKNMENTTSKTYRIFEGQLVELIQVGEPTVNTFGKTGLNYNMNNSYIKGNGFAKWVQNKELEYPYSNFYWKNN